MSEAPDERLKLVYEEALRALTQQQAVLDNLRSRATLLLSAVALVSSFLGAPVIGNRKSPQLLIASSLLAMGVSITTVGIITLPLWHWDFRTSPRSLLSAVDEHDLNSFRRNLAWIFEGFVDSNERKLSRMQWLFVLGLVALACELVLLAAALTISR